MDLAALIRRWWPAPMAIVLSACSLFAGVSAPADVYVPTFVGLISDIDHGAQDTRYTLADGRQFSFPRNGNFIGGSEPPRDSILIAGSQPVPFVAWAPKLGPDATTPEGCYVIFGKATADSSKVFLAVGDPRGEVVMVFPKSPDWADHGVEQGSNQLKGPYTCLNPQGQAFARGL